MKKKILIYNDNSKRDLLTLTLLKTNLKKRGYKVIICNPNEVNHAMYTFQPHIFIGARADHSSPIRKYSKACKVFIVPGEGGHMTKETMLSVFLGRSYWKLDSVDWITKCYLWSEISRTWLMDSGMFKEDQLMVAGNPRLDVYSYKNILEKKKNNNLVIGVAFSSKSTSTYFGQFNYIQEYLDLNENATFPILANQDRNFEDISWRDHGILRRIINVIKKTIKETDYNFVIRPSPFENTSHYRVLEKVFPNRVTIDSESTLPDFISKVDVILTCWSTVGLEALIMEKPVVSISGLYDKKYLFDHISKKASGFETFIDYYYSPETYKDIINHFNMCSEGILKPSPKAPQDVDVLLEKIYNFPKKKSSSDFICDDIENEIKNSNFNYSELHKSVSLKKYFPTYGIQSFFFKIYTYFRIYCSGNKKDYFDFRKNKNKNISRLVNLFTNIKNR
jgi:surface carbohydrate biosynthesis protein